MVTDRPRSSPVQTCRREVGRSCSVCAHAARGEIDHQLLGRINVASITAQYGLTKSSIHRHRESHLKADLEKATESQQIMRGSDLLAHAHKLYDRATSLLDKAEKSKNIRDAVAAMREVREALELLGRLLGSFDGEAAKIDARTQVVALVGGLSTDELRALARSATALETAK